MNYLGFFGKLPEKGDFIQDGLDISEREVWDDWLQRGMSSARGALAESWGSAYVCRRAWRFLTRRGAQPGRSGILMLSRDRVGREFPFLVLFSALADAAKAQVAGIGDIEADLALAQRLVETAYDGSVQLDQLAALLRALPEASLAGKVTRAAEAGLVVYTRTGSGPGAILETAILDAMLGDEVAGPERSLWWRHCADGSIDRVVVSAGAMDERLFLELLAADSERPPEEVSSTAANAGADQAAPAGVAGSPASAEIKTKPTGEDPVDFDSLLG